MKSCSYIAMSLLVFVTSNILLSQSNEGREFWLGFMEHRDPGNTKVVMITSRVNTIGTISMPGRDFTMNFSVMANDVTLFELPAAAETIGSEFINNNGLKITAQDDISVYMHQYFGMRSEASVVLPKSSVGSDYYVIAYTGVPPGTFGQGGPYPSEFLIVANEDETAIEYTLSANTQNVSVAGDNVSIMLNAGEVYQVRSSSWEDDLTGTFISGDKNYSVFAGTPWSQVPIGCTAMDNILEQMYPIDTWGTKYVASPFFGTNMDLYRIIASENNTLISIQGSISNTIELNAGEFYETTSSDGAYIESNKPISIGQFIIGSGCNGGIGDPSMVILNTIEQIRDTVTLFNSAFENIDQNYINVICKEGEEDLIFLDKKNVVNSGITFNSIGTQSGFLHGIIPTNNGAHTLYTSGCGIIAMAYGYGNVESYAYSGGASFTKINQNPIPEGGCLNDTIVFDSGLPADRFDITWDLGDGTFSTEHNFEHFYPDLGSYPLSVIIEDLCFDEIDTIYRDLQVTLRKDLTAFDDQSGCVGTTINLGAFDLSDARYEWTGPQEYEAEDQFPIIENVNLNQAGLYQVVGNISGCKTFPIDVFVEVYENPSPFLGEDEVLCTLDGDRLTLEVGIYESYEWQDGSTEPSFEVDSEGIYFVSVKDMNECIGIDTINIARQCPTRFYVPNVFSPNGDGIHDFFGVTAIEMISMRLEIYDRWGKLIYSTTNTSDKWDGNSNGHPVEIGQYIWTLEYEGYLEDATVFEEKVSGGVMVLR